MTKPAKFPLPRSLAYASGSIGYQILDRLVVSALLFFYVPSAEGAPLFVTAKVFGAIFLFGRIVDSVADPLVSYWSDKSKSPKGRRVPFLLYGGLPLVVVTVLLFFPPVQGISWKNTVYIATLLGLFFFFFTYYVCPYLALVPELGRTRKERINLTTYKGLFMLIGSIIATVFWAPIADAYGFKTMALFMGAIALVFAYMPVFAVDENKYCESTPCSMNLFASLSATFKNKPFVIYLIGNITFWFGFNIISSGVTYYITVLMDLPLAQVQNYMAATFGTTILFMPVVNLVCKKYGKRATFIILLFMFTLILPSIYFLNASWLPVPSHIMGYILLGLAGIPLAGLFVVPDAIVADLTDYDEMLTGERHEAMYFGAQGFFLKVNLGISTYLMTLMFDKFGNSVAHPLGVQLTGPVAGLFALIGMIAFIIFPKDIEQKVEEFRKSKEVPG